MQTISRILGKVRAAKRSGYTVVRIELGPVIYRTTVAEGEAHVAALPYSQPAGPNAVPTLLGIPFIGCDDLDRDGIRLITEPKWRADGA